MTSTQVFLQYLATSAGFKQFVAKGLMCGGGRTSWTYAEWLAIHRPDITPPEKAS